MTEIRSQQSGAIPQHPGDIPRDGPQLTRITPESAAPGTRIKVEGFRLGANLDKDVQVIFTQGTAEYVATASGSEYQTAGLESAPQALDVVVPERLQTGSCLVVVDVAGRRTSSLELKIQDPAIAPVLEGFRPLLPQPGEMLWIDGSGFSDLDEFEITDAFGKTRHCRIQGSSDADGTAFKLPLDLPGGETKVRVIEHRSGSNQVSNTISFSVVRGPAPLDIAVGHLMPVAPGQWLDFVVTSGMPIEDSERVEVSFRQKDQLLTTTMETPKLLRVQVPSSLAPGSVEISTRTWVSGEPSVWSPPVHLLLLDKPAPAKIYSIDIRPVKAEAGFKQGDRIVAVTSVREEDYPRVRVPTDKLSPGTVHVMTRVWRGGRPSSWLFKHYGFSWPTEFLPDGTMGVVPFMDEIYLGPETTSPLVVYRGESLVLRGTYPVASAESLQLSLECVGHLSVQLRAKVLIDPKLVRVKLPADLEPGDWELLISNDGVTGKLPIKLRIPF